MRTLIYLPVAAVLVMLVVLAWLVSTTSGARWLVEQGSEQVPAFSARVESGNLLEGLVLTDPRWQAEDLRVAAQSLSFRWTPLCLRDWTVCMDELRVTDLTVERPPALAVDPLEAVIAPDEAYEPAPLVLPDIAVPVELILSDAVVEGVRLRSGDTDQTLDRVALAARWSESQLTLESLELVGPDGELDVQGQVRTTGDWPLDLQAGLRPQPGLTADRPLDIHATLGGVPEALDLAGTVEGLETGPVAFDATVKAFQRPLQITGQARAAGGHLTLEATLSDELAVEGSVDIAQLGNFWPGLGGELRGDLQARGTLAAFSAAADLEAEALQWNELTVDEARLAGEWRRADGGSLALSARGVSRDGDPLGAGELSLKGTPEAHELALDVREGPVEASVTLEGGVESLGDPWRGRIRQARVAAPDGTWQLQDRPALELNPMTPSLMLAAHCWGRDELRICAEPLRATPESGRLAFSLPAVDLALLDPWLPPGIELPGQVAGDGLLRWQADRPPEARLTLVSENSQVLVIPEADQPAFELPYNRIVLDTDFRPERANVRLGVAAPDLGTGGVVAAFDPAAMAAEPLSTALSGQVWFDGIPLAPLAGALPQIRSVAGRLAMDGALAGTVPAPRFQGQVTVRDGEVWPADLASAFEAVSLVADVDGDRAELSGGVSAGEGRAELDGQLDWSAGTLIGDLRLRGESLEIDQGTLADLRVSPDLRLALEPERIRFSGDLSVPWARIALMSAPTGAVRVSPDVVRVDRPEPEDPGVVEAVGRVLESDLLIRVGDDVRFEGYGASGRVEGELRLRQVAGAEVQGQGILELREARYRAYGQELGIRRGRLVFAGPLDDPRIDIEAVREVNDVVAGVRLEGSVRSPGVTLFSQPVMEQGTILAYLLTGQPPGRGTPGEEALLGQAALSFGMFGGARIGEALAEELGLEDFQLEAVGRGDETQVALSGYLAPNLLIRYGVGVFEPVNTLSLRYYFNRQLYLEAVSGAENAVDIFYSFDYD